MEKPAPPASCSPEAPALARSRLLELFALENDEQRAEFLSSSDPLGLLDRARRFVFEEGHLIGSGVVALRATALILDDLAGGLQAPAGGDTEPWLNSQIEKAIRSLLLEAEVEESAGHRVELLRDHHLRLVRDALGLELRWVRPAWIRAESLPKTERHAFKYLVIGGYSANEYARSMGTTTAVVLELVRTALAAIEGSIPKEGSDA